jgi:squalene cyclase
MPDLRNLVDACDAAIEHLGRAQGEGGLWRDFRTLAGSSEEWVSAFVAAALARGPRPPRFVDETLKTLVHRQRRDGGWGYSAEVPPDCDSTAWALIALAGSPILRPSVALRAGRFIALHRDPRTGGFSTYAAADRIDRYIAASPEVVTGWTSAHVCVTATALQALALHPPADGPVVRMAIAWLREQRSGTGEWTSYWWSGTAYATYHALRALLLWGAADPRDAGLTHASVLARQRPDGSWAAPDGTADLFETAWNLRTLLLAPLRAGLVAARRAASYIVHEQRPDGSWRPAPILRIPPPFEVKPEQVRSWRVDAPGTGVVLSDERSTFTSAAALGALANVVACG